MQIPSSYSGSPPATARRPVRCAAERRGGYASGGSGDHDGTGAPFDLPLLREVPELAGLLEDLREVDRILARALRALRQLQESHLAEEATGVGLGQWLAQLGRRTGADRAMLTTAAAVCRRLPVLADAFDDGHVSWSQLRAVALKVHRLPAAHDDRIERELAAVLSEVGTGDDPDVLARTVDWVLRDLQEAEADPVLTPEADVLVLQPRLDGSGGTVFGDFGPESFGVLDAVLNTALRPAESARSMLGAPDRGGAVGRELGRRRAARLLALLTDPRGDGVARVPAPGGGDDAAGRDGHVVDASDPAGPPPGARPPVDVKLLVRAELGDLLELADRPAGGQVLTHLSGGRLQLDAATARRLADVATRLRLVVTDRGRVVGVGRQSPAVPGWLRDATLALHDTCTAPGCEVAARVCDTDHAHPYQAGGTTDIDNLAPLCASDNHRKERQGWRCRQHADARRDWHHRRSGLRARTSPATWQPSSPSMGRDSGQPGGGDTTHHAPGSVLPGSHPPGSGPPGSDTPGQDPPVRDSGGSTPPGSNSSGSSSGARELPGPEPPGPGLPSADDPDDLPF